jgi:hypothetical protein
MKPNFMTILHVAANSEVRRVMLALLMVGNCKLKGWLVSRRKRFHENPPLKVIRGYTHTDMIP